MIRAELGDEILSAYAGGSLPSGLSLLTAAYLTYSPEARDRVAQFEAVGGLLLETAEPESAIAAPSLASTLALLDGAIPSGAWSDRRPARPRTVPPGVETVLPRCLVDGLGVTEHDAPWRFRLPGISEACFEGFGEGEEVSLLRASPGAPILSHTHEGLEATLILSGAMEDRGRILRKGEVTVNTSVDDHKPRILDEGTCICFVVMTGQMRFTGPIARVLNYLT